VKRARRPWSVTWLSLGVLTIAGINLLRFIQALRQWQFLRDVLAISPLYIVLTGLVWAIVGVPLAWGIWRGWHRAVPFTLIGAGAYSIYYWLDRQIIARYAPVEWKFSLLLNLAILLGLVSIFTRRKVKDFYGEKHGQRPKNSTTA
jgi:hypothetical protein